MIQPDFAGHRTGTYRATATVRMPGAAELLGIVLAGGEGSASVRWCGGCWATIAQAVRPAPGRPHLLRQTLDRMGSAFPRAAPWW